MSLHKHGNPGPAKIWPRSVKVSPLDRMLWPVVAIGSLGRGGMAADRFPPVWVG